MTETPAPAPRSRWIPTLTQFRLVVLMLALGFGLGGMIRQDQAMVDIGIVFAVIGVILRFARRPSPPPVPPQG